MAAQYSSVTTHHHTEFVLHWYILVFDQEVCIHHQTATTRTKYCNQITAYDMQQ